MIEPKLDDMEQSQDLGLKSKHKMIYHACESCEEKRWVRVGKDNQPTSRYCLRCGQKIAKGEDADLEERFRRGENREGKISEAWGDNCYTCGIKTKQLHRKDGQSHDNVRRMSVKDFEKLYNNDRDKYVKSCKKDHPRVHRIADDGWCWGDLEKFIKELYEEEERNEF